MKSGGTMEFIGREEESSILEREYGERSSLVIIYGRRRVGKTALIDNFLRDKTNSMYFLATEESVVLNLERFSSSVSGLLGIPGARFSDWESALDAATKYGKTVIAIDEFQYLAQSDPAIPSIFQHAWDTILSKRDVMLILCGSFIGMMERYTLNYSSPLYGRRTASLKLGPLTFSDVCSVSKGVGYRDLVERYAVTGGVPRYMEIMNGPSLEDDVYRHIVSRNGILYEEPLFLLKDEVKDPVNYISILRMIAAGNRKISDIAGRMEVPSNRISPYLSTLIDMGIVERMVPVTENSPERCRNGIYRIKDGLIGFWFSFVYPYKEYLDKGYTSAAMENFRTRFDEAFVSFRFEDVCREIAACELEGYTKTGSYWNKDMEIDVVAVDPDGRRIFAGECMFRREEKVTTKVLELLKAKCSKVRDFEGYSMEYGLFSTSGFDENLKARAEEEGVRLFDLSGSP